eukprot:6173813-Prymnesium_polylepis.1
MALWPVGIPLLYAALQWASRDAIFRGIPSPLSEATAYLWSATTSAFWWEPIEMCRKLALTGEQGSTPDILAPRVLAV